MRAPFLQFCGMKCMSNTIFDFSTLRRSSKTSVYEAHTHLLICSTFNNRHFKNAPHLKHLISGLPDEYETQKQTSDLFEIRNHPYCSTLNFKRRITTNFESLKMLPQTNFWDLFPQKQEKGKWKSGVRKLLKFFGLWRVVRYI